MLKPFDGNGGRLYKIYGGQPDDGKDDRVEGHCLGVQRAIADALRSRLAAAMRCRHLHLSALVLHHAAAVTLLHAHLRIGNHAGHGWSQA